MATNATLPIVGVLNSTCLSYVYPDLPWIQQPRSALAFISFTIAVIGLAASKYVLFAVVDRARHGFT